MSLQMGAHYFSPEQISYEPLRMALFSSTKEEYAPWFSLQMMVSHI